MDCFNSNPLVLNSEREECKEDISANYGFGAIPFCLSCWNWNLNNKKDLSYKKKINETLKDGLSLNHKIKVVRSRRSRTTIEFVTSVLVFLTLSFVTLNDARQTTSNGIFIQLPYSSPPTVRPPPYAESSETCPAMNVRENWIDTICGDLNKGYIPSNPLGHKFPDGASYPFEIIKNKTLVFFRHALPVLKSDKSLPKVARFNPYEDYQLPLPNPATNKFSRRRNYRQKRATSAGGLQEILPGPITPWDQPYNASELKVEGRSGQMLRNRFCENPAGLGGLLCKMYNTMWGKAPNWNQHPQHHPHQRYDTSIENNKRQYPQPQPHRNYNIPQQQPQKQLPYEALHQAEPSVISSETNMPATPCPSSAEYLTPVFARNHEGAWRYVVQIPREGYFTQTVEVTKCTEANCFYMDGSCRTSPRWQSLLVAEMYYPDKEFPLTSPTSSETGQPADYQKHQRFIQKRKARTGGDKDDDSSSGNDLSYDQIPPQCDGLDEIGCFQVRLFYDWFLIPGSCKCWKRQFDFTRVHQSHR